MTEAFRSGTPEPSQVAEADKEQPVRLFIFEPNQIMRDGLVSVLGSDVAFTCTTTLDEAMQAIKEGYKEDSHPFDRALLAPGQMGEQEGIYPAERITYVLKQNGMNPSAIAFHSSRDLRLDAQLNGVRFLFKGVQIQEVYDFLSISPKGRQ